MKKDKAEAEALIVALNLIKSTSNSKTMKFFFFRTPNQYSRL